MTSKLALFFPGMGYTTDKPLLHYAKMIARSHGYELIPLSYDGFPKKVIGDATLMRRSFDIALEQTDAALKDIDLASYDQLLFVGKSIGTIVAAHYAQRPELRHKTSLVLYTPLDETFWFDFDPTRAIAFSGWKDQWTGKEDNRIPGLCAERGIPCHMVKDANHSLETGDALRDLKHLKKVMKLTEAFVGACG